MNLKETVQKIRILPSFLIHSGTTGNPKGVVHSHGWGYAHLRTTASKWLGVQEDDLVWATAAPGWQKWIWSPFLAVLGSGATAFVHIRRFDPKNYLSILQDHKINVLCCTPTEYRLMAKVEKLEKFDLSSVRSAVSAGEPLNSEVINKFLEAFSLQVRDGYGQTENTLLVGTLMDMTSKPGSMGKPTPGNLVDVINDLGESTDQVKLVILPFILIHQLYLKDIIKILKERKCNSVVSGY